MLSQPACDLVGVDAELASQTRHRHIRPQAQCHQLGFRLLVVHAAPIALAAKVAVLAVLCAKYGAAEVEMLEALLDSRSLNGEVGALLGRMEVSPAYVGYIHSGLRF